MFVYRDCPPNIHAQIAGQISGHRRPPALYPWAKSAEANRCASDALARVNLIIDLIKLLLNLRGMDSLTALADPTRRQIVEMLSRGERASGEIAEEFEISAPAISQHLKVLREAKLVQVRVDAQRRVYTIDPDGLTEIETWLHQVRQFWKGRLDALGHELRAARAVKSTRSKS